MNGGAKEIAGESGGKRYNHHRLDVYEASLEFLRWRQRALPKLSRNSNLADQLDRASTSVSLNIAEGSGEVTGADQRRFFRIARRSATECDAALDVIEAIGLEAAAHLESGRELIRRVIAMLTVLARPSRPR